MLTQSEFRKNNHNINICFYIMADASGVNIEISEIKQVDTSDLNNETLEDFTTVEVNNTEDIESENDMKMIGMFPKKRSLKRNIGRKQLQKHKTMLNALKKYKKNKTKEENQPVDKLGRFKYIQKRSVSKK